MLPSYASKITVLSNEKVSMFLNQRVIAFLVPNSGYLVIRKNRSNNEKCVPNLWLEHFGAFLSYEVPTVKNKLFRCD